MDSKHLHERCMYFSGVVCSHPIGRWRSPGSADLPRRAGGLSRVGFSAARPPRRGAARAQDRPEPAAARLGRVGRYFAGAAGGCGPGRGQALLGARRRGFSSARRGRDPGHFLRQTPGGQHHHHAACGHAGQAPAGARRTPHDLREVAADPSRLAHRAGLEQGPHPRSLPQSRLLPGRVPGRGGGCARAVRKRAAWDRRRRIAAAGGTDPLTQRFRRGGCRTGRAAAAGAGLGGGK